MVIQNKACYSIVVNDKYICIVGKQLCIYSKADYSLVCCFSDSRNYVQAEFIDEDTLISKSSRTNKLLYHVYDISKKQCINMAEISGITEAQLADFILSTDKTIVYDIITYKLGVDVRFYSINVKSGNCEFIKLDASIMTIFSVTHDDLHHSIHIMHERAAGRVDERLQGVCTVTVVDYRNMTYRDIFEKMTPVENCSMLYYENKFVIFENMDVVNIYDGKVVSKLMYDHQRMKYGGYLFESSYVANNKFLVLIYSSRFIIYDIHNCKIAYEHEDIYCSSLLVEGNRIYMGTWEKAYVYDFVWDNGSIRVM